MKDRFTSDVATPGTTIIRGNAPNRALLKLTALTLAMASAAGSYAQQVGLEEIVVTATRRDAGLQSVPISITAVSAEDLDDRGITSFADVSKIAAGVYLEQLTNLTNVSLRIRGVGTAGNSAASPSVGVLVDGVYQIRQGAAFTEMLDVERVEVLRGPQGTLFGKNTTAGVIHIHTKDPDTTEFSGSVQGVLGNLDNAELRGIINIPLVEDKLAVRVAGYTAERDGYTRNLFLDEDTRNVDREGGRIKLLWNATDDLEFKLTGEKLKQQSRMDRGMVEYGSVFDPFQPLPPIGLGEAQQQRGATQDEVERYILHASWALPNHTLSSISSVEKVDTFLLQDRDGSVLRGLPPSFLSGLTNSNTTDATTQELQLASDWNGPVSYVLGAFWQNEELESTTTLFIDVADLVLPRPPSVRDITSKAYFGNVTYELNDQWGFTVGVRYSDDEVAGSNSQFPGPSINFEEWTYSTKLQFQLDPNKMLYIAYDKGFKDGGINREFSTCGVGGRCVSPEEATWDPEFTYNHELGFKTEWLDSRLRVNGAIFYQNYEDFQVNTTVPNEANTVVSNAAEVNSMGIETDFMAMVGNNLTIEGSLAWIETEYDTYQNAPCPTPTTPGCVNGVQDLSGETLSNSPELTANLGGEYRNSLPAQNNVEWFARIDISYRDDQNLSELLSPKTEQDSYTLTNARLGLEAPGEWKLTLWGNNLGDKEYAVAGEFPGQGLLLTQGLSRTYGVTADWLF